MQHQYVLGERYVSHPRDFISGRIRLDDRWRWRDAKFIVFTKEEEQLASDIFTYASKVSHLGIVMPWFCTKAQVEGVSSFLICYDDLRNVHAHMEIPPQISIYEKEMILYPGFFTEAYQAYPHLGRALL